MMARIHASLWVDRQAKGRLPGANDLLIAATALALDWDLATADKKGFEEITGLRVRYV